MNNRAVVVAIMSAVYSSTVSPPALVAPAKPNMWHFSAVSQRRSSVVLPVMYQVCGLGRGPGEERPHQYMYNYTKILLKWKYILSIILLYWFNWVAKEKIALYIYMEKRKLLTLLQASTERNERICCRWLIAAKWWGGRTAPARPRCVTRRRGAPSAASTSRTEVVRLRCLPRLELSAKSIYQDEEAAKSGRHCNNVGTEGWKVGRLKSL